MTEEGQDQNHSLDRHYADGGVPGGKTVAERFAQIGADNAEYISDQNVHRSELCVIGYIQEVVAGKTHADEVEHELCEIRDQKCNQRRVLRKRAEQILSAGLVLRGSLCVCLCCLGGILVSFEHLEMREVKNNKQYTEAEGSAAVHIDLSDDARGCGSNDRCGIGKDNLGGIGPGSPGRGELRTVLRRFARDRDHGYVCHIREIPADMAGDGRHDDQDGGADAGTEFDELKRIEERYDPRNRNEPGAVAAPLHRL